MKLKIYAILAFGGLTLSAWSEPAEINGPITTGETSVAPKLELERLSRGDLKGETEVEKGGRKIIYQEIEGESADRVLNPKLVTDHQVEVPSGDLPNLPEVSYTVTACVFPNQRTLVKWWDGPEKNYAWSNVDFNNMVGFHQFTKDRKIFVFQLFVRQGTEAEFTKITAEGNAVGLTTPPAFQQDLPGFHPVTDLVEGGDADTFVLGLHEIYAHREEDLKAAVAARTAKRETRKLEALNPKPKEDITIRFRVTEEPTRAGSQSE